jgi:hypothetical protein
VELAMPAQATLCDANLKKNYRKKQARKCDCEEIAKELWFPLLDIFFELDKMSPYHLLKSHSLLVVDC